MTMSQRFTRLSRTCVVWPAASTCSVTVGAWQQCGGTSNCASGATCTDAQWYVNLKTISISRQSQSARHTVLCSHSFPAHRRHATHMHALQTSLLGLSPFTRPSGQIIQADRCTVAGSKVACIKLSQALLGKASICWQMNPTLTEPVHDQLWAAASEDAPHNHQEAYTLLFFASLCMTVTLLLVTGLGAAVPMGTHAPGEASTTGSAFRALPHLPHHLHL